MPSQGFATGDLADDVWAIRHFFRNTSLEILVAQSFSKNFGLYGERVGALHVVCRTEAVQEKTLGMLTRLSGAEITSAPIYGARIVAKLLADEMLKKQWLSDLAHMSSRMRLMRRELVRELRKRGTPGCWDHFLTDVNTLSHSHRCLVVKTDEMITDWHVLHDRLVVSPCKSLEREAPCISSAFWENFVYWLSVSRESTAERMRLIFNSDRAQRITRG